jgi:hypothetical protein
MTPVVHEDLSRPHRRAVAVVTDADTIHPQVEAVHMDGPSRSGVAMRCLPKPTLQANNTHAMHQSSVHASVHSCEGSMAI